MATIFLLILLAFQSAQSPSLDLTKPEIEAGAPLAAELNRLDNEAQIGLNKIAFARTDVAILEGARQWREAVKDKAAAQARYDEWLSGIRKAHDCAGCELDLSDPKKPRLVKAK